MANLTTDQRHAVREELRERLAAWSSGLLNVLGLAMLGIIIVRAVADLSPHWQTRLNQLAIEIWIIFVLDFLVQFALAPVKTRFLRHNWLLALSAAVPAFRVVHVVRALIALRAIGLAPGLAGVNSATRTVARVLHRHDLGRALVLTGLVTIAGAVGFVVFEEPGPSHFGTALWWSAAFVTTVGSNFQPRTFEGRTLALLLVAWGLGVVGYVTAAMASTFVGGNDDTATADSPPAVETDIGNEVGQLRQEIVELKGMVAQLLVQAGAAGDGARRSD